MGHEEHQKRADRDPVPAKCVVLTVSDTRTAETDVSGRRAFEILAKFGHTVIETRIIRNDRRAISAAVAKADKAGADLILTIGGTGLSKRDVSVEAVRGLLEKELPGFGELFRSLSAKEIGTGAMLSRALLGSTKRGALVAALPGSEAAVKLALESVLMNELRHMTWELKRYS